MIKCDECVSFEPKNQNVGLCKLHPPVLTSAEMPASARGYSQPVVDKLGGCGDGVAAVMEIVGTEAVEETKPTLESMGVTPTPVSEKPPVAPTPASEKPPVTPTRSKRGRKK